MYKCSGCGEIFNEPDHISICAEDYYGVSSQFDNYNYMSVAVCPYCGGEDIEEVYDDWEFDEE